MSKQSSVIIHKNKEMNRNTSYTVISQHDNVISRHNSPERIKKIEN